jgi:ADP-ribose pyrophosphatase YjhB (NUDIX family)
VRESPPVVVYVTREHPRTGVDELLVFDIPGEPEYQAILPGGGIDPGETVEETAVREAMEETGIEVEVLRIVGVTDETHFVQARPIGPTPDAWEHWKDPGNDGPRELVSCRWITLRDGLDLWGRRGAFVQALVRRRAVAYVTRERDGRMEILTIEEEGVGDLQVPAGRLEHGESLEEGLRRELAEETGLTRVRVVRELEGFEAPYETFSINHAFHLVAEEETPEEWRHTIHGDGVDAGLVHLCRWLALTPDLGLWKRRGDPMLRQLVNPTSENEGALARTRGR